MLAGVVLAVAIATPSAPTLAAAEALVRSQYAADADPSPDSIAKIYAPDIVAVMDDPERGTAVDLGVDPRFGQDQWKLSDLKVTAAPGPNGEALVTARFLDFGKPAIALWRLVPAADGPGWRVLDVSTPLQNNWAPFDLREELNLPPAP